MTTPRADRCTAEAKLPGALDASAVDRHVLRQLLALGADQVRDFNRVVAEASDRLALDYVRDSGERILIPVNPLPAVLPARPMTRLAAVLRTLAGAVAKTVCDRLEDPWLAEALPLSDWELEWLRLARRAPGQAHARVFHRWDLTLDPANDPSLKRCRLFEVNSVDVGGIHYAAATREVLREALESIGVRRYGLDAASAGRDARRVMLTELRRQAHAAGHTLRFVAIAENQEFTTGITEAASLARFLSAHGVNTACVDARAFAVDRRKRVVAGGRPVDLIYRNVELRDMAEMEAAGADLAGFRAAVSAGIVLSSPFGELDHKSLWEALGAPERAERFTPSERRVIAQHIPWTRLLRERRSAGRDGAAVDLPAYVRRHRTSLVMKPNRSCGGQGVTIGAVTPAAQWDQVLSGALAKPNSWVVQDLIPIPRRSTVRLGPSGRFEADEVYAVYGVFRSPGGLALVGRSSHRPVVNVMQGGGMLGILGRR